MNPIYKTYHHEQFGAIAAIRTDTETGYLLESISRLRGISSEEIRKMVPSQWFIRGIDGERYVLAIALPIIFPDSGEDDPLMTWLYNHIHEGLCAEQSRTPKAPDSSFLTAQEFQQFVDENGGHVLTEFLETKVEEALGLINQKLPGNLCRVLTVDGQPSIEIPTGNGENYDHLVIRALESTISDPFTEPVDPTPDTDHWEKVFEGFKTVALAELLRPALRRFHDKMFGELHAFPKDGKVWFSLKQISAISGRREKTIIRIAGRKRTKSISTYGSGKRVGKFISSSALFDVIRPLPGGIYYIAWVKEHILKKLLQETDLTSTTVSASLLHAMIEGELGFQAWINGILQKHPAAASVVDGAVLEELQIPMSIAKEEAVSSRSLHGMAAYILLREAEECTGGQSTETVTTSLMLLIRLSSHDSLLVEADILHCFMGSELPFSEWIEKLIISRGLRRGIDYLVHSSPQSDRKADGGTTAAYLLTADIAGSIATMEPSRRGQLATEYMKALLHYMAQGKASKDP